MRVGRRSSAVLPHRYACLADLVVDVPTASKALAVLVGRRQALGAAGPPAGLVPGVKRPVPERPHAIALYESH